MRRSMQEAIRPYLPARCGCALLLAVLPALTLAQTTVSVGVEYAEGKYGEPEKSTTWTAPFTIKHETGPWMLKANIPYVRSSGTAAAGGDRFNLVKQSQEGWGDLTATVAYDVIDHGPEGLVVGIGAKAKWATADHSKDLLTTGRNDYSAFVELLKSFGPVSVFATLGRTKKGDPDGTDYRNPWFSSLGASYKFSDELTAGVMHDFRQRLTPRGAQVSEMTVYVERKFAGAYKIQFYLLRGLADASPDLAIGATLGMRF